MVFPLGKYIPTKYNHFNFISSLDRISNANHKQKRRGIIFMQNSPQTQDCHKKMNQLGHLVAFINP